MAKIDIPYLTARPGALLPGSSGPDGTRATRWFWEPSRRLRAAGWRARRLSDEERQAIEQARALNAKVAAAADGEAGEAAALQEGGRVRAGSRLVTRRSIAHLCAEYRASLSFSGLAPRTAADYGRYLAMLDQAWGSEKVAAIGRADVHALYAPFVKAGKIATGNALIRVLRLILGFARTELRWIADNPAAEPALRATAKGGLIWPRRAVPAMAAAADALGLHSMGTAIILNEWLGLRPSDLIALPRGILDGAAASLQPSKTARSSGAWSHLPLDMVPALVARLAEEAAHQKARGWIAPTALICELTGRPWIIDTFSHQFAVVRKALAQGDAERGIAAIPRFVVDGARQGSNEAADWIETPDLIFRHLRHTAITRLAEAGATAEQIAAITGHSFKTVAVILEHYLKRTAPLARAAFQHRLDAEAGKGGRG